MKKLHLLLFLLPYFLLFLSCKKNSSTIPTLTTTPISSITGTTAISGGYIASNGGSPITAEGVFWSTSQNHTGAIATKTNDGTVVGSFTSNISGLTPNTIYYVIAYATNSIGTGYGSQVSFNTSTITPILTTTPISSITGTTAISGGNVVSNGGSPITAEGIIWSTSPNPTISLATKTNDGTVGTFTSNISGLLFNTTYYVVAYATNSIGTSYGNQVSFKTLQVVLTVNTIIPTSCGSCGQDWLVGGDITSDGGDPITERGIIYTIGNISPIFDVGFNGAKIIMGSGIGLFSQYVGATGLLGAGKWGSVWMSFRAYATNGSGTFYGQVVDFYLQ